MSDTVGLLDGPQGDGEAVAAVPRRDLIRCGAEIVELSERFYRGTFLGITVCVGIAALAALVLLPLRAGTGGAPVAGYVGGALLVAAAPLAIWRVEPLYRMLRRRSYAESVIVLFAAALVAAVFPLRSQLWWPSCALVMLVAVIAPILRVLTYCVIVLAINLLAHVLSGDLSHTPAVSIIGLWIGYIFWSLTVAAITDQLAAHLLRLNSMVEPTRPLPRRVMSWNTEAQAEPDPGTPEPISDAPPFVDGEPGESRHGGGTLDRPAETVTPGGEEEAPRIAQDRQPTRTAPVPPPGRLWRLTARQLQVVALLADGLRYHDVAACLSISDGQVQRHVARAVERLGVGNATELVAVAVAEGLVPPHEATDERDSERSAS
jgi:DNA-binding CsgD family transcriptional regulator